MRTKSKLKAVSVIAIILLILGIHYLRVSSAILDVGDTDAEAILTTAIYAVIDEIIEEKSVEYEDFFNIVKAQDGNIACLITNGLQVNSFTSEAAIKICNYLDEYTKKGIDVPCGIFTGIKLLSAMGKPVNIKLLKISSAKCDLVSKFETAGINQVKHSLYISITPDVTLKAIGRSKQVKVSVSVLLYENLIVGKVPEIYLGTTVLH